jgi:hypothetical protein
MAGPPSHPDTGTTGQDSGPAVIARPRWKTLAIAAAAAGITACLAAYLVFQAFLPAGDAMRTTLADPGVLRAVVAATPNQKGKPC